MADLPRRQLGRTGLEVTMLGYGAMELRGAPRGRDISEGQAETILHAVRFLRRECIDRASPARRRGHADAGIGGPCLGGLDVVPTETRRLVLGSNHNGGMAVT